jgi:hypothetical protein
MSEAHQKRWSRLDRILLILLISGIAVAISLESIERLMIHSRSSQWETALLVKLREAPTLDELTAWLDSRGAGYRIFSSSPYEVQAEYLLWTGLTGIKPHFGTILLRERDSHDAITVHVHTGSPRVLTGPQPMRWLSELFKLVPCMVWGGVLIWFLIVLERRYQRLNRACCPECGYPISTSDVCTECGTPNPIKSLPGAAKQKLQENARKLAVRPK